MIVIRLTEKEFGVLEGLLGEEVKNITHRASNIKDTANRREFLKIYNYYNKERLLTKMKMAAEEA